MKTLNKRQQELITKASVNPAQIFEHMDALNAEIAETYDMEEAESIAKEDPTLKGVEMKTETVEEFEIVDEDDALAKEAAAAEAMLKKQLEEVRKKQEETKEAEAEDTRSPEEKQRDMVLDLLAKTPGAPGPKAIAALKQKYGEDGIHVLTLGEKDIYIFTYLRRGQWQQIQKVVQAAANSDIQQNPEELIKEKVIQYTVKWPQGVGSPEFLYNSRAGVVDTLYQSILLNSYFLSPQQAMMLTSQL